MKLQFRPAVAVAACIATLASPLARAASAASPRSGQWAHVDSALKPDPRVVWGRLDNGLRYALLPHKGVPGRVSMKFIVLSGSMDERPDELGIAHFTEHMAFHGSEAMSESGMLSLFRKLGAEYGSDVNAVTTFDSTIYSLDFRENEPALLADGLRLFRGIGESIKFEPAAIEQERRVIFAEKRNRDSLADRTMMATFPVVFRGLRFAEHAPIGTDTSLRSFRREQFLDFYKRCYRPDLMVLVAAGDFDAAALEGQVRQAFGDIPRPSAPIPERDEGRAEIRSLRAGVFRINGVGAAEVMAASVTPEPSRPDTRESLIEAQRRGFVMELFENRLRIAAPNTGDPQASYNTLLRYDTAMASVRVAGNQWSQGILTLDHVIRDTLKRGFEASEINTIRGRYLRLANHMAEQLPVLDPSELCADLADSITSQTVFVGPATEYEWMQQWLGGLSVGDVNQTFRNLWDPDAMAFNVSGDVGIQLRADEVLKTVQRNRRGELSYLLPTPPKDIVFSLKKPGKPTEVVERREVPELNAVLMRFGNNVRLNFVPNRQEPGLVRVTARVGSGLLTMPGNQPALKEFGLNTFLGSGTVYYQPDDIAQIIDRRFLEFSFDVADSDAFTFRGLMGAENLDTFLGLVTEFLRSPKFNPYAHRDERVRAAIGRASGAMGFQEGMREMMDYLFRGDARFMSGTPLDYISLGVADVRRWMDEPLTHGYLEVTIVGDTTEAAAAHAISRTLGTLPTRAATKKFATAPKPVEVTAPPGFTRIEFVGELNMGMVVGNWPVEGEISMRNQAALEVLSKILELRIRTEVRERLGYSYAPAVAFQPFGGFDSFALMQAHVDCTPSDSQKVADAVRATAAKLAEEGAGDEEFEGGRGIVRGQLKRAFLENGFLVNALKRAQEDPDRVKQIIALHNGLVDQLTLDEINGWAKKLLPANNARIAMIVPKPFVGIFDTSKP